MIEVAEANVTPHAQFPFSQHHRIICGTFYRPSSCDERFDDLAGLDAGQTLIKSLIVERKSIVIEAE
jgi:hypothetical protein